MTLHEIHISEIQPGDLWLLVNAWVRVVTVEAKQPADRVWIEYVEDGETDDTSEYRGFDVAVVKRRAPLNTIDLVHVAARELIEAYDAPFLAFGGWADRLEKKVDTLRELVREPE